jgi:hypothetical protein
VLDFSRPNIALIFLEKQARNLEDSGLVLIKELGVDVLNSLITMIQYLRD